MLNHNRKKARLLYSKLDAYPEVFIGHAQPDSRSLMNVTFKLPSAELEKEFLSTCESRGLCTLKGQSHRRWYSGQCLQCHAHRSVSLLADTMEEFCKKHG